jgi:hypothetical protein
MFSNPSCLPGGAIRAAQHREMGVTDAVALLTEKFWWPARLRKGGFPTKFEQRGFPDQHLTSKPQVEHALDFLSLPSMYILNHI